MIKKTTIIIFILQVFVLSFLTDTLHAASHVGFIPETVTQPTGEIINLYRSGDVFHDRLHDIDGFTVIKDPTT